MSGTTYYIIDGLIATTEAPSYRLHTTDMQMEQLKWILLLSMITINFKSESFSWLFSY